MLSLNNAGVEWKVNFLFLLGFLRKFDLWIICWSGSYEWLFIKFSVLDQLIKAMIQKTSNKLSRHFANIWRKNCSCTMHIGKNSLIDRLQLNIQFRVQSKKLILFSGKKCNCTKKTRKFQKTEMQLF